MGPISLTIPVDAPRERVFDLICDLSARPAWTDHFADEYRLERLPPRGRGAAARFRVGAPAGVRYMETVIAEAERPHRIVEHGRGGRLDRLPIRMVWELHEGPTTNVTLTLWTEPANRVDRIREAGRSRWWRRRWAKALRRLRELVEAGIEAPRAAAAGGDRLPAAAA
ncbi:MAG TPA: SRPBCC family protein [Solirubrobacterales bacterium]|nr:SRPBCC family protein [Solirubrobacterales bacterium]